LANLQKDNIEMLNELYPSADNKNHFVKIDKKKQEPTISEFRKELGLEEK
jgi:hypothetical protein